MRPRKNAREAILDAAETVVIEKGAAHLTLDAVSQKAGVSKGGLLYHFGTKAALLSAMMSRLLAAIDQRIKTQIAKLPETPARKLKANILASPLQDRRTEKIASALLAAAAHDPLLMEPARKFRTRMFDDFTIDCELPTTFAAVMTLAMEGLMLAELLGLSSSNTSERRAIVDEIMRLIDIEEARK